MKNVDVFAAFNMILFVSMCIFAYYDRFISYRGRDNVLEFFVYAVLIASAIVAAWYILRSYSFSTRVLVLIEVGILMHFSGGLVHIGGSRLYDNIFFGLRYDKYVHLCNSLFGSLLVKDFFDKRRIQLYSFESVTIILVVLGFGAVIEIAEYFVTKTVPRTGVGDYDNNMQDLMANLAGGALYAAVAWFGAKLSARASR